MLCQVSLYMTRADITKGKMNPKGSYKDMYIFSSVSLVGFSGKLLSSLKYNSSLAVSQKTPSGFCWGLPGTLLLGLVRDLHLPPSLAVEHGRHIAGPLMDDHSYGREKGGELLDQLPGQQLALDGA